MKRAVCPLCETPAGTPYLHQPAVPLLQNAPAASSELARSRVAGELAIVACSACGFSFNAAFDVNALCYDESYDNTQCSSPVFEQYMVDLANYLIERHGLRGKRIVEVGCGKGDFLRLLCRLGGNQGFGFDSTYEGPASVDDGQIQFVRELYSETHAELRADFVCCRHVLEHVSDPRNLLDAVRRATGGDPDVGVFFEVPTVDWIFENACFWDFFYEHCNYFSADTLAFAFRRSGFEVTRVQPAFGGQYLWLEARPGTDPEAPRLLRATDEAGRAAAFGEKANAAIASLATQIVELDKNGGVAIWGAGAKGVTFANVLDPDAKLLRYVIDINPYKQHKYVPGTAHRIVAPSVLRTEPLAHVLVMNPRYLDEIRAQVDALGAPDVKLIGI